MTQIRSCALMQPTSESNWAAWKCILESNVVIDLYDFHLDLNWLLIRLISLLLIADITDTNKLLKESRIVRVGEVVLLPVSSAWYKREIGRALSSH